MDLTEQLRVLEAAQRDPAKLALATVDLAYPTLDETVRATLKQSLEAAAIPHWCDETILAPLHEISLEESAARLERLRKLTVIEPFPARGDNAVNVHEATRLALRKAMATDSPDRFRILSGRASALFADDLTPTGRIEWIYHVLCEDPDRGATELEKLNREWGRSANIEDRYALSSALNELKKSDLVKGRALAWVLLSMAWIRIDRGEASQLLTVANDVMELAKAVGDKAAEGDANCLFGDVYQAQGKMEKARAAYDEYRAIVSRLSEQDWTNEDRQADLAVSHNRVGGVLEAQGQLAQAQEAFLKSSAIFRILVAEEPSNSGRRREFAAAQSRVGDILLSQGKLEEAYAAYKESLSICQELVNLKPSNADWQRLLATAHSRMGDVLQAQGKLMEAGEEFGKYLSISRQLVDLEPTNSSWQLDLAAAISRIGDLLQAQNLTAEAQAAYEGYLLISQRLVDMEPENADRQKHLAAAQNRIGDLLYAQGKPAEAQVAYEVFLSISQRLVDQDSSNAGLRQFMAAAHNRMGDALQAQGKLEEADKEYRKYLSISRQLVRLEPTNTDWQRELAVACIKLARVVKQVKYTDALPLYEEATRIFGTLAEKAPGFAQWAKDKEIIDAEFADYKSLPSNGKNSETA